MSFWTLIGLADRKEILALQSEISILIEENKTLQEQQRRLFENLERANKNNFDVIISEIKENNKSTNDCIQTVKEALEDAVSSVIASEDEHITLHKHTDAHIQELNKINHENAHAIKELGKEMCSSFKIECSRISEKVFTIKKEIVEEIQKNAEISANSYSSISCQISECTEEIVRFLSRLHEQMDASNDRALSNSLFMNEGKTQIDSLISISKKIQARTDNLDEVQEQLLSLAESLKHLWTITKAIWVDSVLSDIDSIN